MELFLDGEIQSEIEKRFGINAGLDRRDPHYDMKRQIALQRFLGYDFVLCGLGGVEWTWKTVSVEDTAAVRREGGRAFTDEHRGPIATWEELEKYPWPDFGKADTSSLEWLQENLPDDMCIISSWTRPFRRATCPGSWGTRRSASRWPMTSAPRSRADGAPRESSTPRSSSCTCSSRG